MMKNKNVQKTVQVSTHNIAICSSTEFAVISRRPNAKGLYGVTFSMPITASDITLIESSGIVHVVSFSTQGTLSFTAKDFYSHIKMSEVVIDILQRYEQTLIPVD